MLHNANDYNLSASNPQDRAGTFPLPKYSVGCQLLIVYLLYGILRKDKAGIIR
jgi:hypothetical protein